MPLTRVLFVCVGNACRSQMAEAFARRYGSDVLDARSAGLAPAGCISPVTRELMLERNIDLGDAVPKGLEITGLTFDLIVNISGFPLPVRLRVPTREWKVDDPVALSRERHRAVRDQVEMLVQQLILEFRRRARPTAP